MIDSLRYRGYIVALIVPCYNEVLTIGQVISEFRRAFPQIKIYVFDNNSSDDTAAEARKNGATVINVSMRGKGNVVRRMFADIEADIYLMVDGDNTYHAQSAMRMVDSLIDGAFDMVIGARETPKEVLGQAYRHGHQLGNRMLTQFVSHIFEGKFNDMLSGYRAFSRRFVKTFPAQSRGFEIETELTIHALELRVPFTEISTPYGCRPEGSASKLSTYKDGIKILKAIFRIYISERPLKFFSIVGFSLAFLAIGLFLPVLEEFIKTGLVPRMPTAILCAALMTISTLSFLLGLILDNVVRGRTEGKRLAYLSIKNNFIDNEN